ncbi:hypothetical protein FFWV33_07910 [Flavobacterium faecale]|uniref:DUF1574 domain-containing protein n=1 Tax=Flavobacterium faecale TaxID=1355330 RepID=A0A2S1LCK0_9FLAO|nr:hypothetical protein [Flavobacterium faecale]AWG21464.1 hypothetical protein FFWV33_07910 [Flavobacterium faecale]
MKRFLKNSILFLLVFFIVDKGFYYFLIKAPEREYDTRLEEVFEGNLNKDIIILGSSRGSDNILAGQIEKATGQSTYNLSYQGSDVTFHYFMLNTLLKFNQKPKTVILLIDNPYEFDSKKSLNFRIDRLLPLAKYNYFNEELITQKEKNLFSRIFCLGRLNWEQITFNQTKKTSVIPIDSFGSMPLYKKKDTTFLQYAKKEKVYLETNESKVKVAAFKKFQYLCKQDKIQLFYVFSPSFMEFNSGFYTRFLKEVQKKNVMVYDSLNPVYKDPAYFYDESHLLETGAKIYTDEIITFIKNKNQTK